MPDRLRLTEENRKWWTLAAMCFALFMIMLDNTVVNVALPSIQADLDATIASLEWTVNAYTLTFAVVLVTGGRLGDLFGRRRMFLFGVVVFAASSALIGLAPSQGWLVAGRAVQGIGAAFMMPGTLSIITDAFEPHERGKAIGTWAGVSGLALAMGPVVGGALAEHVSWRAIFFLNLPVAVGAVAVTLFAARESRDPTVARTVDLPGIAALSVGLTAFVLALIEGHSWGWTSPEIVALVVLAAAALAAFAWIERRSPAPMVQFEFFRSRTFLATNLVAFVVSFSMLAMFFFVALYMQNIRGWSPLEAGLRFIPSTAMIVVVAPLAGRLSDRIGSRAPITIGLALVSVALYMLSGLHTSSPYSAMLVPFVLMGGGIALVMSPMSAAAMNSVDVSKAGVASGILSTSRMVGATFGVAAVGAIFQTRASGRFEELVAHLGLGDARTARLEDALGSGSADDALRGLDPQTAAQAAEALRESFVHALSGSLKLSAAVAASGAVVALMLIEPKRATRHDPAKAPAAAAEEGVTI